MMSTSEQGKAQNFASRENGIPNSSEFEHSVPVYEAKKVRVFNGSQISLENEFNLPSHSIQESKVSSNHYPWLKIHGEHCLSTSQERRNDAGDLKNQRKRYRPVSCELCMMYNPNTSWAKPQARKYETSRLVMHEESSIHRRSVASHLANGGYISIDASVMASSLNSSNTQSIANFPGTVQLNFGSLGDLNNYVPVRLTADSIRYQQQQLQLLLIMQRQQQIIDVQQKLLQGKRRINKRKRCDDVSGSTSLVNKVGSQSTNSANEQRSSIESLIQASEKVHESSTEY